MSERASEYFKFQGRFDGSSAKPLLIVFLITTTMNILGCSSQPVAISLTYSPQADPVNPQQSSPAPVHVRVVDSRTNKDAIAVRYSAHGMVKANMVPDKDVAITVVEAIESELKNRGFDTGGDGLGLEAELHEFFAYNNWSGDERTATADLLMTASLNDASGSRLFRKMVRGTHSQPVQDYGAVVAGRLLETALSNAISGLFQDTSFLAALAGESQDPSAAAKAGGDARPRSASAVITISGRQPRTDLLQAPLEEIEEVETAQVSPRRDEGYCYFAFEYSMRSSGTFPVRLSIDSFYSKVLTLSDREIDQLPPGRHVVTLSDPLTGRRNRPNWDDYEFEIDLVPFTYTKVEIVADPGSTVRMLTVNLFENGELTRTLFVGSK